MKNLQNFRNFIRQFSISVPSSMRLTLRLCKASENLVGNSATKSAMDNVSKELPKSFRARKKSEPFVSRNFSPGAFALLTIPVTTFGLGVWQIERRRQKAEKICQLEFASTKEPVPLPEDLRELDRMEYMPVKVFGEFFHDEELIVKPRHRHDVFRMRGGAQVDPYGHTNDVGAQVITPFKLVDRPYKILVQRGWVPLSHVDPETRKSAQIKGQVEIVGLVRGNEKRPKYVGENEPLKGEWNYRDVEMMARMRNCAPAYIEAVGDTTLKGGPIGGQTILELRDEHLSYIITWFGLSAVTSWLWYKRCVRPMPLI